MATLATVVKSAGSAALTLQKLTSAPRVTASSLIDVSTAYEATFYIHFGRAATTALTAGVNFRIEGSSETSGTRYWFPITTVTTGIATSETEALSGTINAGDTTLAVASTTNLTAGDLIIIENGTIGNSEWARIKAISANVSITIEDPLTNAQTGSSIFDQAEIMAPITVNCFSLNAVRVVVDGSGPAQNFTVEIRYTTCNSISST